VIRGARFAYAALAWAFVAAIVVQVFLIGLGLFAGSQNLELHRNFGWILHLAPLPVLVLAALARAGRRQILQAVGLVVVIFFVPILAAVRSDLPSLAAFHPVGALLAFWLATVLARNATSLAGSTETDDVTTRAEWVFVALIVVVVLFVSLSGSPEA
jgi:bacteriorhodopsin